MEIHIEDTSDKHSSKLNFSNVSSDGGHLRPNHYKEGSLIEHMYGEKKMRNSEINRNKEASKGRIFRQVFLILLGVCCIPTLSILQA